MTDKIFKELEGKGKLRKQKAGAVQIEALLRQSLLDLGEAKKIVKIAERATYISAYMAMLKAGRALLLSYGYVPDDGAQHRTVVEVTDVLLGDKYRKLTDHFETMRRKRNEMTYEAGILLSKSESERALSDAISLVKRISAVVRERDPQLRVFEEGM